MTTNPATPPQTTEVGYVTAIRNYLITMNGLPNVKINELLTDERGNRAMVISLGKESLQALMLDSENAALGERFTRSYQQLSTRVGNFLLGRTINPLGMPIDGKGRFPTNAPTAPLDQTAGGIKTRQFIKETFETGITTIDLLIPIAKGQRELIIGPARSGRTSFIIDTIVNQKNRRDQIICVYAMIGKPSVEIKRLVDVLTINKALEYTVIIATSSADQASLIYLTPSVGITIAEFFQRQGKDVLLVMDDLGIHAKFIREISLLGNRSPARESYPADIFSQHAKIIERAGNFKKEYGGGSITALPVIETSNDDYATFIPTNLMSMTDGHIMFNSAAYHQGKRPAVDIALSVSRVGKQTQSQIQKVLADKVKTILAEGEKLETLSKFGSELSSKTQITLNQNKHIESFLKQASLTYIPKSIQVILLGLVFTPFLQKQKSDFIDRNKQVIISYLMQNSNLQSLDAALNKIQSEEELLLFLNQLIPNLEKICK